MRQLSGKRHDVSQSELRRSLWHAPPQVLLRISDELDAQVARAEPAPRDELGKPQEKGLRIPAQVERSGMNDEEGRSAIGAIWCRRRRCADAVADHLGSRP